MQAATKTQSQTRMGREEGIKVIAYEPEALEYIAKLAEGGMRDAITMLDKCLSYASDVTLKNVVDALDVTDYDTFFDLTTAILEEKPNKCITIIENLFMKGKDLKQFKAI